MKYTQKLIYNKYAHGVYSQIYPFQVAALQQKRTLAFVNHFVLTNVQFLNNFMKRCEQKLMDFDRKLEKVNAAMILLEARVCWTNIKISPYNYIK